MPELPEVETTLAGIKPHCLGETIVEVQVYQNKLRWPVPSNLNKFIQNQSISAISRRGKYLLLTIGSGTLIIHLGMSGKLRIVEKQTPRQKHDHVQFLLSNNQWIRFNDPRRFGCILYTEENPMSHPLLRDLGPEPLTDAFTGDILYQQSKSRRIPVKQFIMDSRIVVGVGNIYANEALFASHIDPRRQTNKIAASRYQLLAAKIKEILTQAIATGGTTLKDFLNPEGKAGYFVQQLKVYGRDGEPCFICNKPLVLATLGGRTTVFCTTCQH